MLMSPMWSMAQVSDGLHVPTRSEVGPQAMPQTVAPVTAPFQFRLATIDRSKFEARQHHAAELSPGKTSRPADAIRSDRPCKTDYRN